MDAATGSGGLSGTGGAGTGGVGTVGTGGVGTGGMGTVGTGGAGTIGTGGVAGVAGNGGAGGAPSSAGCALIMHMDEVSWSGMSGEVVDSCGHNNGTAVKILGPSDLLPNTTTAGHFGRAGAFDDSNGCVRAPDDPSLRPTTQLTLAAWIFPTAFSPASNGIVGKRTDFIINSSYSMFLWNDGGATYHLYADIGNDRFFGGQAFSANVWYHVALVFDGSLPASQRVRLYVDGSQDGEFTDDATTVPAFQTPLHVGCMPSGTPSPVAQEFIGKIDEVAIWTRALGAAEILRLAQATLPL